MSIKWATAAAITPINTGTGSNACAAGLFLVFGLTVATQASAQVANPELQTDESAQKWKEFAAGHGSYSIEFARPFYHGDYQGPAGADSGQVQFQSVTLEAAYFVADNWEVRASIPFSRAKSDGLQQHPQLPCPLPDGSLNCPSTHVDDGKYHGTWVDWDFGLSYHTLVGNNYYVTPMLDVYIPSHNYQFYGSAVVGQRVTKYGLGVLLEHQLDFSNFYYTVAYQYVFKPRIIGLNSDYNDFAFNLGYFVTPSLSVRLITDIKYGHGLSDADLNSSIFPNGPNQPPNFNEDPIWPLHDKVRKQNHANVGVGVDYTINARYLLSFSALTSVWGQSNARLQNGIELKLTRTF